MKTLNSLFKIVLPGMLLLISYIRADAQVSGQSQLIINEISGGRHATYLKFVSEITFSEGKMTVKGTDSQISSYEIKNIDNMRFFKLKLTGVNETESPEKMITLFPNPVSDFLQIRLNNQSTETAIIQIVDFQGRIMVEKENSDAEIITINNLNRLSSGIYLCRIIISNQTYTTKFIKK
jgi:hypothetical protein